MKIKSAVATSEDGGIKDLKQKIDQLTTVIKSSTFAGTKPKKGNAGITNVTNGQYTTSAAGSFKDGQKPYQCYNCGGWGHSYRQCLIQGVSIGGA